MKLFKNAIVYSFAGQQIKKLTSEDLEGGIFKKCLPHDELSRGWSSPLENQQLVHEADGRIMINLRTDKKVIPSSTVNQILQEKVEAKEASEGCKVPKKEQAKMKDEIIFELLPRALEVSSYTTAYIDYRDSIIVVNASSAKKAEDLLSYLRKTLGSLPVKPYSVKSKPDTVMASWLSDKYPKTLVSSGKAGLSDPEDGKINYRNINLLLPQVRQHVDEGCTVRNMGVVWQEKMDFTLNCDLSFKGIKLLDMANESANQNAESLAEQFDIDFVLFAGTFSEALKDLTTIFDGQA